ncbi:MAG: M14 family zinc carboxypeptidase [Mariprofundus sp.]|nr:M14 family zinc carboxypeptidase [Mariprofundus sp.]
MNCKKRSVNSFWSLLLGLLMMLFSSQSGAADLAAAQDAKIASQPIIDECTRIGAKLGSVSLAACLARQLSDTGGRSVNGQSIMLKEYPPLPARKPLARILLIGGTHGDEYSAVSMVFNWMAKLDRYHSGLFHWHVVPLLNPDGLLQRHSQRLNAHGVDLNRNMLTPDWYKKTQADWLHRGKDPRRNPGLAALSEPESIWLYEQIRQFKPDAIVSLHAPYGVLDFDGPPKAPAKLGFLRLKLIGTYPGSLGNSIGVQHHIPVITVELPYAGIMPSAHQTTRMWGDLVGWLRHHIPKPSTVAAYARFDEITKAMNDSMVIVPQLEGPSALLTEPSTGGVKKRPTTAVLPAAVKRHD